MAARPALAELVALQRQLQLKAHLPPAGPTLPVRVAGRVVGQAFDAAAAAVVARVNRAALADGALVFDDHGFDMVARTALLAEAAHALRDAGLAPGWRDEPLDVRAAPEAAPLATIERAACRPLGIPTVAVHMNGCLPDGRLWVARRAEHKMVDPGLWDNLVGGMVAAGESLERALEREAYEEAGLALATLQPRRGGLVHEARPVFEGYMVETVQVFDVLLPADFAPRNVDGEVAVFAALTPAELVDRIAAGVFTLEAGLVTLDHLLRRAGP
jgi:8-oxo-dGTP pyrophosphatase MutT (NUDIX family)